MKIFRLLLDSTFNLTISFFEFLLGLVYPAIVILCLWFFDCLSIREYAEAVIVFYKKYFEGADGSSALVLMIVVSSIVSIVLKNIIVLLRLAKNITYIEEESNEK